MKFINIPKALKSKRGEIGTIIVLIGMAVIGLGILIGSQVQNGRINLLPRASEGDTLKIMTFNVLSEPLCRGEAKHKEEMARVMKYIKDNHISLAALQEVVKLNGGGCENFDLPQYIQDNATGYSVSKSEYIHVNRDSDNEEDDIEKWWYRLFVQDSPMIGDMQRIQIGEGHSGFDVMVMNTKLGPIRFIHLHNHHHQMIDSLVPLVNQFKAQDSIPIIVLGDFNIIYDGDNGLTDEFQRLKYLEAQAGLYRACDPNKFPNAGCTDTVKGTDEESNLAVDHIFIDNRANFIVKNAYVDKNAFQSPTPFSDHMPIIVELAAKSGGTGDNTQTQQPTPVVAAPAGQNINIWNQIKPAPGNIYVWSNGGPTAGWESYFGNRAYMCNGKYCWTFDRNTLMFTNNGNPIAMDTDPGYSTLRASSAATGGPRVGVLPWYDPGNPNVQGPTAAWTWIVPYNGQTVNENVICNGNYCWRYLRYPDGVAGSGWRDGGNPIYLPTYGNVNGVWLDSRVAPLWTGNGITVAWTDPINSRVTLCNHRDCRSLDYKNWAWRYDGASINSFPPGVTEVNSAWTSPTTSVISLCSRNVCSLYDIAAAQYKETTTLMSTVVTSTPTPTVTVRPTNTPTPTRIPSPTPTVTRVPTSVLTCTDSDGGNNPNTAGTTTATTGVKVDSCFNTTTLNEFICSGTAHVAVSHTCKYGCSAGRCNPTPAILPCTDSDGGNNPNIQGYIVSDITNTIQDSCSGSVLTERYCSSGAKNAQHTCAYGCGSGKCLPQPPTATPIASMGVSTLSSPINAVAITTSDVTLRWTAATGATSYDWILIRGTTGTFKSGTVTGTTATVTIPPGSYRWQVTAKGPAGSRITGLAEFNKPFSKIRPLSTTQLLYGSTTSFEWTPLLSSDMGLMYLMIYSSTNAPIYYKEIRTTSTEYLTGKASVLLNSTTNAGFTVGKSFTWQLVASRAGVASEHRPPDDSTGTPQSFSLVATLPTATPTRVPTPTLTLTRPPIATATKVPVPTDRCYRKSQGDADCDGIIHLKDAICWILEAQNKKPANCKSADFNGNGKVGTADLVEFGIWRNSYIKVNTVKVGGDNPTTGNGTTN